MKRIITLLTLLLIPAFTVAEPTAIRNETQGFFTANEGSVSPVSVDRFAQLMPQIQTPFVLKVANDTAETGSTASVIVATAHAVKVGDTVHFTTVARSGTGYVTEIVSANSFRIAPPLRAAPSNGDFFWLETSARVAVDANDGLKVSLQGAATGVEIAKVEGATVTNGDAGFQGLIKLQSALTADSTAGTYGSQKGDLSGRTLVTPAVPEETFQSCGTATAVTSDVAIKAAVASNRMYVTSITCKNTSTTVGPTLDFKDGATIIAVGGIPATSATGLLTGEYHMNFGVPLRGTSATALNFATNTATTSVTCCAHGYISTQ